MLEFVPDNNAFYENHENSESIVEGIKLVAKSDTKDESEQLQFTTFGKSYTFQVIPTNSIFSPSFKILQSKIQGDGDEEVEYFSLQELESLTGAFYTDINGQGSFYVQQVNGQIQMEGIVDDTIRIWNSDGYHMASKISNHNSRIDVSMIGDIYNHSFAKIIPDHKVAMVEVLVLLDQIVYRNLTKHQTAIKKYLGIFWNFVQNKFRATSKPKVQLSLSAVVVLDNLKWISDSFILFNTPDANTILDNMGHWLYQNQIRHPKYDVAILQTGLDLARVHNNQLGREIAGVALTTGVCKKNDITQRMLNCGIIEDFNAPLYLGAFTGAHELAHILGSHHDDPSECTKDSIMAAIKPKLNANVLTFSDCSLNAIRRQLNHPDASCVYNTPHSEIPILPEVPNLTRDEMCKLKFGENSKSASKVIYNQLKKDICSVVLCFQSSGPRRSIKSLKWVPEGTSCFSGKVCIQGNCIKDSSS
uniref:Peptidase M12B domain-containing protein n=1 Tax=Strigamia maritima TaxID=126957 RepID=T1JBW1_STRMM